MEQLLIMRGVFNDLTNETNILFKSNRQCDYIESVSIRRFVENGILVVI